MARAALARSEKEACDLLAPVYGPFTEGFDTLDLKRSQGVARLLDELTS
jgi:hypothetical protein